MNAVSPPVGEAGATVRRGSGQYCDDVFHVVTGWVVRILVVVSGVVSGRGHEQHVVIARAGDFIPESLGESVSAPTIRKDPNVGELAEDGLRLDGKLDRGDGVCD